MGENVVGISARAVRSAESNRSHSCLFANVVAEVSLDSFLLWCPPELKKSITQTVMAAFLVQNGNNRPEVVSIGMGTKYVLRKNLKGHRNYFLVRDQHAEILAKRGFRRYLVKQIRNCKAGDTEEESIFVKNSLDGVLRLRDGISVHFYCSSQPCGNATIKKWAKSKRPKLYSTLKHHEYPTNVPHACCHISARKEGQIALLLKFDESIAAGSIKSLDSNLNVPVGLTDYRNKLGLYLSCSDKILLWNTVGVQSALLSHFCQPIYVSTVTIGRKFSEVHCERAFCCRLPSFKFPSNLTEPAIFSTHHPAMLCTSVKFDKGTIATEGDHAGARFSERRSMIWSLGCTAAEILDSSTGLVIAPNKSEEPTDLSCRTPSAEKGVLPLCPAARPCPMTQADIANLHHNTILDGKTSYPAVGETVGSDGSTDEQLVSSYSRYMLFKSVLDLLPSVYIPDVEGVDGSRPTGADGTCTVGKRKAGNSSQAENVHGFEKDSCDTSSFTRTGGAWGGGDAAPEHIRADAFGDWSGCVKSNASDPQSSFDHSAVACTVTEGVQAQEELCERWREVGYAKLYRMAKKHVLEPSNFF